MKLTKERLVQIIKEEVHTSQTSVSEQAPPKIQSDVERIKLLLPKIDNNIEYEQLLDAIISLSPRGVTTKNEILKKARGKINIMLGSGTSAPVPPPTQG